MPELSRVIQFYGRLELTDEMKRARFLMVYLNMLRYSEPRYANGRFLPEAETFHGYASIVFKNHIVQDIPIRHDNNNIVQYFATPAFLHQSISCSLEAILTSFVNLGLNLGLPPIQRFNPIKDYALPVVPVDIIQVRLNSEQSICKLTAYWEDLETCSVEFSEPPEFDDGGQAPTIPELFPPSEPDDSFPPISPPYDGVDDGGNTFNPGPPTPPGLPVGGECQLVAVTGNLAWETPDLQSFNYDFSFLFWGTVETYLVRQQQTGATNPTTGLAIISRGRADTFEPCGNPGTEYVISPASNQVLGGSVSATNLQFVPQ